MAAIRVIMRQLQALQANPIEGVSVAVGEDLHLIEVSMAGPASTPYEGGVFKYRLFLPQDYPASAPRGQFITPIFHPNVAPIGSVNSGDICVNTLKKDWDSGDDTSKTLAHVVAIIRCLMIEPNAESALNDEAGRMLCQASFSEFEKRARMMTQVHAMKHCADAAVSSASMNINSSSSSNSNKVPGSTGLGAAVSAENANTMQNSNNHKSSEDGMVMGVDGAQGEKSQQQESNTAGKSKAVADAAKRRQMLKRL